MRNRVLLLLLSLLALSCSNSSSNNGGPSNSTTMQWTVGSRTTFVSTLRDSAANNFDMELPSWHDTIVRTIISTNQTIQGRSNVTIYRDSDTRSAFIGLPYTTGYISQDNDGSVWIYDYALDAWSEYFNNKFFPGIGWVKCYDPQSSAWSGSYDIGAIEGSDHTYVLYDETLEPDDTVSVNGKSYAAKHILYTVSTSTQGYTSFFTVYVDSYLVFGLGMPALEIEHSFVDWGHGSHYGITTRMLSQSD
jgi:hypothetical protein